MTRWPSRKAVESAALKPIFPESSFSTRCSGATSGSSLANSQALERPMVAGRSETAIRLPLSGPPMQTRRIEGDSAVRSMGRFCKERERESTGMYDTGTCGVSRFAPTLGWRTQPLWGRQKGAVGCDSAGRCCSETFSRFPISNSRQLLIQPFR